MTSRANRPIIWRCALRLAFFLCLPFYSGKYRNVLIGIHVTFPFKCNRSISRGLLECSNSSNLPIRGRFVINTKIYYTFLKISYLFKDFNNFEACLMKIEKLSMLHSSVELGTPICGISWIFEAVLLQSY